MKRKMLCGALLGVALAVPALCPALMQRALAQKFELGGILGGSNYVGDIHPVPTYRNTGLSGSIFGKANFNPYFGIRAGFMYGRIAAYDTLSSSEYQLHRKLGFRSPVMDAHGAAEFNFFKYVANSKDYRFTPYLYGGVAVFRFKPEATLAGENFDLLASGTGGQQIGNGNEEKRTTSKVQIAMLYGGGIKYNIGGQWSLGLDLGARRTFTDYLDDVSATYASQRTIVRSQGRTIAILADPSQTNGAEPFAEGRQRGNTSTKDWYYQAGVALIYTFPSSNCPKFK